MKSNNFLLGRTIGLLRNKVFRLQQIHNKYLPIPITVEEGIILNMIQFNLSPTIQEIAFTTDKSKSVVLRMIDSLEKKGLVIRGINPSDRREKPLQLTDLGLKISQDIINIKSEISSGLLKDIPAEDLETALRVADMISRNADKQLNTK